MTEPLRLRCSALPLAFKCPGSVHPSELPINDTSLAAETGTTAHEGLRPLVERGSVDWDAVPELARRHGVNEDELRGLLGNATKLWHQVKESFPDPLTEVELAYEGEGFVLTGHADILARSANTAHVGDWKGGRLDADHREQLLGYAGLALLDDHTLEASTAGVLWIREQEYEHYAMSRAELPQWLLRVQGDIVDWDGTYRPGPHCKHCRRNHECPAANALVRRDVAAIANLDFDAAELARLAPQEKVRLTLVARHVQQVAERVIEAMRENVLEHGDIVGDGQRLTLQHEERRHLDVVKTFPVLDAQGFDDADMSEVIKISASNAEGIIAKRAGKGHGAKAVREFRAQLEAAGAVRTSTITKLVVRRA